MWTYIWPLGALKTLIARWLLFFFFSSRRRHTRLQGDWSSDVCSSDLFGFVDTAWLNASKKDPYSGVTLELLEDFLDLDARIAAVGATIVIIDTVGNEIGRASCRERV